MENEIPNISFLFVSIYLVFSIRCISSVLFFYHSFWVILLCVLLNYICFSFYLPPKSPCIFFQLSLNQCFFIIILLNNSEISKE